MPSVSTTRVGANVLGCMFSSVAVATLGLLAWELLIENPVAMVLASLAGLALGLRRSLPWDITMLIGNAMVIASYVLAAVVFTALVMPATQILLWVAGVLLVAGSGLIIGSATRIQGTVSQAA